MKFLRIDDFFSNTRLFNQRAKSRRINFFFLKKLPILFFGNWLFFKRMKKLKAWAPFSEINTNQLLDMSNILEKYNCSATLAITATFVDRKGNLIPFFEKYPEQSKIIKAGVKKKIFHIANHGLTHCILENKKFLPKLFSSNRKYHREFYDWVPYQTKKKHIIRSKSLLEKYFNIKIDTFVPPGNVWCDETEDILIKAGINKIITDKKDIKEIKNKKIRIINTSQMITIHTKDLVERDNKYFYNLLAENNFSIKSINHFS